MSLLSALPRQQQQLPPRGASDTIASLAPSPADSRATMRQFRKPTQTVPYFLGFLYFAVNGIFSWWDPLPITLRTQTLGTDAQFPPAVRELCSGCHAIPQPDIEIQSIWVQSLRQMFELVEASGVPVTVTQRRAITKYYLSSSPEEFKPLPYIEKPTGLVLKPASLGRPPGEFAIICNVNIVDLDQNGLLDVVVCDADVDEITWIHRERDAWVEATLASDVVDPSKTEVFDIDDDGDLDIVVGSMGSLQPTDDPLGKVVLLTNDGTQSFSQKVIMDGVSRVADVRPGDFDNDGDVDFIVAVFGFREGSIHLLEQTHDGRFTPSVLSEKNGGIHLPTIDLDGDGRLDFIALLSQENEEIVAFLNRGRLRFRPLILFAAQNPLYGSSGVELVDFDQDGDQDIVYSNGDAWNLESPTKPYHGIQWLENKGELRFEYRDIHRLYGVYRAIPADMDGDGDLDVVATSMFNQWSDEKRQSLVWLENDGEQRFVARKITNDPNHLITADVADLNGDGRPDIVAGVVFRSWDVWGKIGRVHIWTNLGKEP